MNWNTALVLKFALFHSKRMQYANQQDNEFYAKQSLEIFTKLNGNVENYKF